MSGDGSWTVRADGKSKLPAKPKTNDRPAPTTAPGRPPTEPPSEPEAGGPLAPATPADDYHLDIDAPKVDRVDGLIERQLMAKEAKEARERRLREEADRSQRRRTLLQLALFILVLAIGVRWFLGPEWLDRIGGLFGTNETPSPAQTEPASTTGAAPERGDPPPTISDTPDKGEPPPAAPPEGM